MKFSKLLLAIGSATVLLGTLASWASARNLSISHQTFTALWRRMNFSGGFGTVECEILVAGTLHSRTTTKTVGSLVGYITAASVSRCARGGATIRWESLPWHRRYRCFTGTLPFIHSLCETIAGAEWTIREPTFGITCIVRREASSLIATFTVGAGILTRATLSGSSNCSGFTATISGEESNVLVLLPGGGWITITLI